MSWHTDVWLLAPDLILLVVASALLGLGFVMGRRALAALTVGSIGIASVVCLLQLAGPFMGLPGEGVAWGLLEVDPFALVLKLVFLAVAGLVAIASPTAMPGRLHQGEYYALLLFATEGMLLVAGSMDLFTLFLGFELSSFASYILAAYARKDPESGEAGLKFFITGSVSSAAILFGISLIYALTAAGVSPAVRPGDLGFQNVAVLFASGVDPFSPLVIFAVMFLLAGFGFKIAAVPFHMWAPDVYQGSPTAVSAFLAAGSKKMGFAALFKVFLVALIALRADWTLLIGLVAVATMTLGNVLALTQTNVKRLLAYSSIAQAGYILMALPVAAAVGDAGGAGSYALAGGIFHIITHAFMKGGAFIVVAALIAVGLTERIEDYRGLSRRAPLMAFSMAVFLISFAGIPPLAGFASKFVLFSGAVNASLLPGHGWLLALAIAAVANSAVSLYYYAKVVRTMYVDDPQAHQAAALPMPPAITASVVIALVAVVVMGLWPGPVIEVSLRAAESLMGAGAPFR